MLRNRIITKRVFSYQKSFLVLGGIFILLYSYDIFLKPTILSEKISKQEAKGAKLAQKIEALHEADSLKSVEIDKLSDSLAVIDYQKTKAIILEPKYKTVAKKGLKGKKALEDKGFTNVDLQMLEELRKKYEK